MIFFSKRSEVWIIQYLAVPGAIIEEVAGMGVFRFRIGSGESNKR